MDPNKVFTDTPVKESIQDKFQRYEFSKRIANTIIENPQKDAVVIGIYGAWGEGKTSVINFIKNELCKQEYVSIINFNPWHYNDERTLLSNFFSILASVLDAQLQNGKEKIGEWIKKYGKLLNFDIPLVGNIGGAVDSVGEILSEVDIEELKKRIEKVIIDSDRKIVIFIDDIDRLDKNEIYSVFRLVKLTADFVNTTYVLSFDEKMVAAAIGNRFGIGDEKAGRDFLEKIVQVPLCIPKASSESLRTYCVELIVKILEAHNIIMPEEDAKNFGYQFTTNIANSLNTPRMAVRYANSLSFALPLLYNEVNITDLMLIEAIKIFYPKHYSFIKNNPNYFISNYKNIIGDSDDEKKEQIKETINDLGKEYSKQQQKNIFDLLQNLFPYFKEAFSGWAISSDTFLNLYKNKNIGSEKYFDRYFSYVVLKGDLSDIEFNNFINKIDSYDHQQLSDAIQLLIRDNAVANFIFKIRAIEDEINWEKASKLLQVLPEIGNLFPDTYDPSTMGWNSPRTQLSIFICNILKSQEDRSERFLIGKEILSNTDTLRFAYEIIRWADVGRSDEEKTFNEKELLSLKGVLIDRLISETGDKPIYSVENALYHTFNDWSQYDKKGMTKYIRSYIIKTPSDVFLLLRSVMSKSLPSNIVVDINKEKFDFIDNVFDRNFIRKSLLKVFPMKILKADKTLWAEHTGEKLSDIDIARQFMHWYNIDRKAKLESTNTQA